MVKDFLLTYFYYYIFVVSYIGFAVLVASILGLLSIFVGLTPEGTSGSVASSYECGFLPFDKARTKFSVNFFVVGLLFVVFDLEVVFMLPWCVNVAALSIGGYTAMIGFIMILGVGFVYELVIGALEY